MRTIRDESKDNVAEWILAWLIAMAISGAMLLWYNHLLYYRHLRWWQWAIIAIPVSLASKSYKSIYKLLGLIFLTAIVLQLLSWFGVVVTPLIRG